MKKFNKIVPINILYLPKFAEEEIGNYSEQPVQFIKEEMVEKDVIQVIGDAEAVLGSWNCKINSSILDACPNIKYIGICGTSLTNIDVLEVEKRGIILKNVTDYGDEAAAEFVFAQLLNLFRGIGKFQWKDQPAELNEKIIGIVGLGALGKQIARLALGFNMKVLYYSRTRNKEWEEKGLIFTPLQDLLTESNIVSLTTPRNLNIVGKVEFDLMQPNSIFVNMAIGDVFDIQGFTSWISKDNNYAIFDNQDYVAQLAGLKNVIVDQRPAARTSESLDRIGKKFINNIESYLGE
jgi:phosphoglycerate dehydrogenase-like enzyme